MEIADMKKKKKKEENKENDVLAGRLRIPGSANRP